MDPQAEFSFKDMFTHIIGDIARVVSERPDEPARQRFVRARAATAMVLDLRPRDAMEAMLAGQIVVLHELLIDCVRDIRGQTETVRRATRTAILSLNKAFHANLDRLEHLQTRRAEGTREATAPAEAASETASPARPAPPRPAPRFVPSREQIAACKANPAAMAALDAGDAEAFAHAMGIAEPGEAYFAAARESDVFSGGGNPRTTR